MSKAQQAIELYKAHIAEHGSISSAEGISILMTKLDMTKFGARTYHSNTLKAINDPSVKKSTVKVEKTAKPTKAASKSKKDEESTDPRQIYSKCFYRDDEIIHIMAGYDPHEVVNRKPASIEGEAFIKGAGVICIVGLPTNEETLTQVQERYSLIEF